MITDVKKVLLVVVVLQRLPVMSMKAKKILSSE
jgi:hypothetical protein